MFIGQFFNGNPNFKVTRVTNFISRVQVNINMCIVLVILKLSVFYFVAEDPGVLDEELLLHPGDQFRRFRNIEIRNLLEKLAYKHVYCPRVPHNSLDKARKRKIQKIKCRLPCIFFMFNDHKKLSYSCRSKFEQLNSSKIVK